MLYYMLNRRDLPTVEIGAVTTSVQARPDATKITWHLWFRTLPPPKGWEKRVGVIKQLPKGR